MKGYFCRHFLNSAAYFHFLVSSSSLPPSLPPSFQQALLWSWQIVRGLWTLAEADIGFRSFSLRNVLLTQPNGEVRLAGFDALLSSSEEGGGRARGREGW
jgi:hypothetical protein